MMIREKQTKSAFGGSFISYPWRIMLPLLFVLVVILAYPLIYSVWLSFRDFVIIRHNENAFVGLEQFSKIFADPLYWKVLRNTFLFVLMAVSIELVLGLSLALALRRQKFAKNLTRSILLTPMFVTPIAVGLMFRFLLSNQLGMIPAILSKFGISYDFFGSHTALLSLAFIDAWQWTPFMVLLLLAGLESLPEEPYEAALVDGANSWSTFMHVTLPMMKPVIIVAVLIRGLDSLKVFEYVYAITQGGPGTATETLQYYVYQTGFEYYRLSEAAAISWTLVIIIMVLVVAILWRATRGEKS